MSRAKYLTGQFWQATGERVISTGIQSLIPALVAAGTIEGVDWRGALSIAGGAALLSLLKCVLAGLANDTPGPSLTGAETTDPTPEYAADAPAVVNAYREPDVHYTYRDGDAR